MRYDPGLIEEKWQKFWENEQVFKAEEDETKQNTMF